MPVFECKIVGEEKPRLVRASSGAAARSHLVTAKPVSAENMADIMADGVKLEVAGQAAEAEAKSDEKGDGAGNKPEDHAPGGAASQAGNVGDIVESIKGEQKKG